MGILSKEGEQLFKEFVERTRKEIIACLIANKAIFPNVELLANRYDEVVARVREQNNITALRSFHEVHNELCTAVVILEDKREPRVIKLEYEPKIDGCAKRFDFHAEITEGSVRYIEVKTIHPRSQDDWDRYQDAIKNRRFPRNTQLILDNEWLGGELYHNAYAARSKMLDYASDMEDKIKSCLSTVEEKITFLVLFTNGFHWHLDELEDFVFFYRKGTHFPGDPFAIMEEHFVKERNRQFEGTIDHFAYFRRPKTEIRPNKVIWSVTLPHMP
ncbi:MAG: hypothetical protein GXP60_03690 [Epsilonproteobacteria bacterium]|nr:hypothetical protein [Campylobacterota bacterium]